MGKIADLMTRAVTENVFPGAVLLVSVGGEILFFEAYGAANTVSGKKMTRETVFDLASLTKPLATALAVMMLVQEGKLRTGDSLASVLPDFRNTDKENICIKNLLLHDSGFPDYRPYYSSLSLLPQEERERSLRDFLVKEKPVGAPGEKVLYSDPGFMTLRWVIEAASDCRFDQFVNENIYRPLSLRNLFFIRLDHNGKAIKKPEMPVAATELCPWRNILIEGVVHDENAYVMGGIEGHAGLFGTAFDTNVLLSELLCSFKGFSRKNLFDPSLVKYFLTRGDGALRTPGFDTPSLTGSSSGRHFSANSVGHLGFTGTSFWMDLDSGAIVILFSNRIHPSRGNVKIKEFRPVLHDAVLERLAENGILKKISGRYSG